MRSHRSFVVIIALTAAVSMAARRGCMALSLFLVAQATAAPSLQRGPYLQSGTPSNIVVRWRTDLPAESRVNFGLFPDYLGWTVVNPSLVTEHELVLTNLAPDTRYYYEAGFLDSILAGGPEFFFVTAPTGPKATRIWVLGDAGTSFNQPDYSGLGLIKEDQTGVRDAYYNHAQGRYTDVWLLLGDNAYNDGNDGDYQTNFFEIYPETIRQSVIWPAVGNHEINLATGDVGDYLEIFSLPTNGEAGGVPSGNERYYAFDYGNIHFVCLDSEASSTSPTGPMLTWLEADLAAQTNDWLIAFWHSPPYSKGSHDSDSRTRLIAMRQNVVPILEAHGVDLVLCGHSHVYERSYLIDGHYGSSFTWTPDMAKDAGSGRIGESGAYLKAGQGPSPRQGAVYVVAGSSGWAWRSVGLNHPAMFIGLERLGSLVIDVDGLRLDAKFLRETGEIDDEFTIIKGAEPVSLSVATFTVEGGMVTAQWKSIADRVYQVDLKADLNQEAWTSISGEIIATGATTRWSGVAEPGLNEAYYRVREVE